MGQYRPNIPIVYETINGVTYASQEGVDEKFEVGYKFDHRTVDGRPIRSTIDDTILWHEMREKAKTHPALKAEMERAIMFYQLIKTEESNQTMWHPV